ncbi:MAG TPA: DUF4129 domain-containing protein [Gemmatimonadales bacterium]|nr:DUF4129 domain-containing protein [Gemmatimonadales bacterium]
MTVALQRIDPDSIRAALRTVFAGREYRWRGTSSAWLWVTDHLLRALEWLRELRISSPFRYYLLVASLTIILGALLVQLATVVRRSVRSRAPGPTAPRDVPARDARWHLAEAARVLAAGQIGEALAHRFIAMLLELDERGLITFDIAKTPAEYVAGAKLDPRTRAELEQLVDSLYRHLFGAAPADLTTWQSFDRRAATLVTDAQAG